MSEENESGVGDIVSSVGGLFGGGSSESEGGSGGGTFGGGGGDDDDGGGGTDSGGREGATAGEVEYKSWFTRLYESIVGVGIGLLLLLVTPVVLFWNEGRAVQTYKSIEEGRGATVSVAADKLETGNDGRPVHLVGTATTDAVLKDDLFPVTADKAVRLARKVEMYQWVESEEKKKEKQLGGGEKTITVYKYERTWSEKHHNSSGFKDRKGHENPPPPSFGNKVYNADKVTLGAFTLSANLAKQMDKAEALKAEEPKGQTLPKLPEVGKKKVGVSDGGFYYGDPAKTEIGDVRVSFSVVKPAEVTVIAEQSPGGVLRPYQTKAGDALEDLRYGNMSKEQVFGAMESENAIITWVLRVVAWIFMCVGIYLIFRPLETVADVIPILGDIIGWGLGLFAFVVSLALSTLVIAVAWLFYRPIIGVPLLIVAVALFVVPRFLGGRREPRQLSPIPLAKPPGA
jgi:hypothetical protein